MRLVSFKRNDTEGWGALKDDGIIDMSRRFDSTYPTLQSALASSTLARVAREASSAPADFDRTSVRLLPPIPMPNKIICIGLNYRAHVSEGGGQAPTHPSLFTRFADTLVGQDGAIIKPLVSNDLDYECELALVIGKPGRHIARDMAMDHVAGYSCFNDASVRDYQVSHSLPAGKNFFATGGFGPWLVTSDEISWQSCFAHAHQRHRSAAWQYQGPDLRYSGDHFVCLGLHAAWARRRHIHRHAGRRRLRSEAAAFSQARRRR